MNQRNVSAILGNPGPRVITPLKGHPRSITAFKIITIDLGPATTIRSKQEGLPIRHPGRLRINGIVLCQAGQPLGGEIHEINIWTAILTEHHSHRIPVRGKYR